VRPDAVKTVPECRSTGSDGGNDKEVSMSDVAKVVTIIGSSPESFAKAADAAVQEAAKTLRGIKGADVISMSANVENDRITTYKTTVNIAFAVERSS
jgi:dodecin